MSTPATSYEQLRLNKQFLLGPTAFAVVPDWRRHELPLGIKLATHPNLRTSVCNRGDVTLAALGDFYDPRAPQAGNDAVVKALLARVANFSDFERESAPLAGRWLVIAIIGNAARIYPDACGLKTVFHTDATKFDHVWAGSQPGLLAEALNLSRDEDLIQRFRSGSNGGSWPGLVSPYSGVLQLWPNHYLDLRTGVATRFWPTGRLEPRGLDECASFMAKTLSALIESASRRSDLLFPLSGGYDCRVLFACAKPLHPQLHVFTVHYPNIAAFDVSIPRYLTRLAKTHFQEIRARPWSAELRDVFVSNMADMYVDYARQFIAVYEQLPTDAVIVSGNVAEVGRAYYHRDGPVEEHIDASALCRLSEFTNNTVAREVFAAWLASVPADTGVDVLDLFYWEHRLGAWFGPNLTGNDTLRETFVPFNCRQLLTAMLSVDVQHRRRPHRLFSQVCELTYPEVLAVPFNSSRRHRVQTFIERKLPWRVRHALHTWRLRVAGFSAKQR